MTRRRRKPRMKRKRLKKEARADIYKRLNGRCAYCGQLITYENMHVEHVQPLVKNGADSRENMLPSCRDCDFLKGERNLEEFRNMLENIATEVFEKKPEYIVAEKFGLIKVTPRPIKFYFETKNIKLDERKMVKMEENKQIIVLLVKPGENPEVREISNCLKSFQKLVDGDIQLVNLTDRIGLICNEYGKILDLELNRYFHLPYFEDRMVGNIVLVGAADETGDFTSLTSKEIAYFTKVFEDCVLHINKI